MTLIEMIAAISISGFALLGALLLLNQLTDSGGRIAKSGVTLATDGNGPRLLRQLLLDSFITSDSTDWFVGDTLSAVFSTSCQNPGGWMAKCRATVGVDLRPESSFVFTELPNGEQLTLLRLPGVAELRYFNARSADSAWTIHWAARAQMPAAVGVVVGGDTVVYTTGAARD